MFQVKKLRQRTVEPVLGTLINFLGMKRLNTRGIKGANKCMLMAAVVYNLKKMMKFKPVKPMINSMELRQSATNLIDMIDFYFSYFFFQSIRKYKLKNQP